MLLQAAELGLGSFPVWGDKHAELTAALRTSSGEMRSLSIVFGPCKAQAPKRMSEPLDQ